MALYKRGNIWWYKFVWKSERFQESTKQSNKRVAEQMEAAHKTSLAKGEVGIREKAKVPTLKEFGRDFMKAIETQCAEKPGTVEFYRSRFDTLAASELGDRQLDAIDEAVIEKYRQTRATSKSRRKLTLSPASVNRELATLRRALRLAYEWKILNRVPRIKLLRGEKNRESILPHNLEAAYFAALPSPLCDMALILVDTGLRLGELISLDWRQVKLEVADGARFGYLTILSGKAKSGKSRNVPLSVRAVEVFRRQGPKPGGLVFHREDGSPVQPSLMGQQHNRVRTLLKLPADFVIHSLRHSFGTRLGEAGADAFTIMKLMGHSTVTVSQRYVHPSPEAVELVYGRLNDMNMHRVATVLATVITEQKHEVQ